MNSYVTGSVIRSLREGKGLTQEKLAELLHVSAKAVSKWETGRGFPDISLLEPLAQTLGISVLELLSGGATENRNKAFNMQRIRIYVCPVCGNVILAAGEAVISCCGVTLPQIAPREHALENFIKSIDKDTDNMVKLMVACCSVFSERLIEEVGNKE